MLCRLLIAVFVNLIGYAEIQENPNITVTKLHPLKLENGPKIVLYFAKALWQTVCLLLTLLVTGKCNYLLCQNPSAKPTLPVCRFYCLVTSTNFVIDWHNYAYTIMALSPQSKHPLLKLSTFIEKYFGQSSDSNLCVTYAMKTDLLEHWNIMAIVLYDRPPKIFHPITLEDKRIWFLKIGQKFDDFSCQKDSPFTIWHWPLLYLT